MRLTRRTFRRRFLLRAPGRNAAIAVLAVAFLATVAACGGSTTASGSSEDTTGGSAQNGPGVTADTVKVGFVLLDTTSLAKALKLNLAEQGDQTAQINALVAWANEHGGVAGRKIEPVIKPFVALSDSAKTEEKLCNEFTQDDDVFAVVLWGMFQDGLRPCFQTAKTVMLDNALYPLPVTSMKRLAPYYFAPTQPTYDNVIKGLTGAFEETGFLDGDPKVGIIGVDTEANHEVYEQQLLPQLKELDSEPVEVRWINLTDDANIRAGYEQAILAFKDKGVDRLITIGGSRLLSYFLDYAKKQSFAPRLSLTTYDNPDYNIQTTPELMKGAIGLSVVPDWDMTNAQLPMPQNDGEADCMKIYSDAGIELGDRLNARTALLNCDAVIFLQKAAAGMKGKALHAPGIQSGADTLGDLVQFGGTFGTRFDGETGAGASAYRTFRFDEACSCLQLVGESRDF